MAWLSPVAINKQRIPILLAGTISRRGSTAPANCLRWAGLLRPPVAGRERWAARGLPPSWAVFCWQRAAARLARCARRQLSCSLPPAHSWPGRTPVLFVQAVPAVLAEYTQRIINPTRRVLHTLLPFLPKARTYARSIKVRCRCRRALRRLQLCLVSSPASCVLCHHQPATARCMPVAAGVDCGRLLLPCCLAAAPAAATGGCCCCLAAAAPACHLHVQICHRWWGKLLRSVRATDLAAAGAAGDTSLRVCLAKLPVPDDLLLPQIATYTVAG